MKRFLLSLLVLVSGLGLNKASATHFAAADIFYDYVGNGPTDLRYVVTLVLYKACEQNNAGLPSGSTSISYRSISCGLNPPPANLPQIGPPDTLDQLCANFAPINSCRVPTSPWPAFERRTYRDTITLPQACTDWTFYWTSGNRNGGILNLDNPLSTNIYVEATLNNVARYSNSSPRYLIAPLPYLCVNQPATYLNGPLEPDNDSVRSINQNPLNTSATTPLPYSPGYSLANPINSLTTYNVNINTATATFWPQTVGKFVLAFKSTEYDRFSGVELGHIMRDVQVTVLNCSAAPPFIDSVPQNPSATMNLIGPNTYSVCPGSTISFNVNAAAQTISNSVILSANNYIAPGSTFTVAGQGTSNATGGFIWTPTGADVGDYTLIFEAKDSTCNNNQPIVLKSYLVVLIKVLPSITAGPDVSYCPPNGLPAQLSVQGPPSLNLPFTWSPATNLSCTTCDSPTATPSVTTQYIVSTTPLPQLCKFTDTVLVTVYPAATFEAGPDRNICLNDTVQLQPNVSPTVTASWVPAPFISDPTVLNPLVYPQNPQTYIINGSDANGCFYRDSVQIIVNGVRPQVMAFAGRDTVCPEGGTQLYSVVTQQQCGLAQSVCVGGAAEDRTVGQSALTTTLQSPFFQYSFSGGGFVQMIYRKEELEAAGVRAGFINSIAFNVSTKSSTAAFNKFSISMGCTQLAELSSPGTSSLVPIPGLVPVYFGNVTTTPGWNTFQFPVPYYWDGNSNIAIQVCAPRRYSINGGSTDAVFASNAAGGFNATRHMTSQFGYYPGNSTDTVSVCDYTGTVAQSVSPLRPNTRFNVC
ncbi:MAG TPA: hypothetical protein VGB67_05900, partial [Fibrella sp.]